MAIVAASVALFATALLLRWALVLLLKSQEREREMLLTFAKYRIIGYPDTGEEQPS